MNVSDIFRYFSPDPDRRRRARFRIMKGYAKRNDFEIYKDHMLWSKDAGFREVRRAYPLPGIPEDRCFVLYGVAKSIIDVPGDLAECGVRFGKSAAIVRWVTKDTGKTLHLFDSFEGISAPDPEDVPSAGPTKDWKRGMLAVDEATVRANLVGLPQIDFHRGWVPQRFADVADATFSLVHLDLDLFQPTRDSLAFFYPRVSPGGVIVCDDYGSSYCPGAMKACDEFMRDKPEKILHLPTGQALISKQ
jgi:hypothetical protein